MFLSNYLFFTNIIFISFCFKYIRFVLLNDKLEKINKIKERVKKNKTVIKKSIKSQLDYIKLNDKVSDYEWTLFGWKVSIFLVAIIMSLIIIRTEPIIILGYRIYGFLMLGIVILINWLFTIFIRLIGVRY